RPPPAPCKRLPDVNRRPLIPTCSSSRRQAQSQRIRFEVAARRKYTLLRGQAMSAERETESRMLAGQTAVVTGGGRGLGRAFALGLAAAGASVAVVARSEHQLSETVAAISEAGGLATSVAGDVSDPFTVGNLAAEIESRLGHVDL